MSITLGPSTHSRERPLISYNSPPSSAAHSRPPERQQWTNNVTPVPSFQSNHPNPATASIQTEGNHDRMDHHNHPPTALIQGQNAGLDDADGQSPLQEGSGQNQDGLDMDMEDSTASMEEHRPGSPLNGAIEIPNTDEEPMDTTTDTTLVSGLQSTPTQDHHGNMNGVHGNSSAVDLLRPTSTIEPPVDVDSEARSDTSNEAAVPENRLEHDGQIVAPTTIILVDVGDTSLFIGEHATPAIVETSEVPVAWEAPVDEEDDDSEEGSSEEEHAYWADFEEDTSGPTEEELSEIERQQTEVSALDHDHWEKPIYGELDDPEYIPGESGRITWILKGVNGTPENPNREKIMRSPTVLIDGFYWNLKFFPRGNEGTDHLSIYIECSRNPPSIKPSEDRVAEGAQPQLLDSVMQDDPSARESQANDQNVSHEESITPNVQNQPTTSPNEGALTAQSPNLDDEEDGTPPWDIAAQVGCVMYNPNEPRVNYSQHTAHRFCKENPDWGWTRFHGPWDTIHKRQHLSRQALLRGDTLAFTAYISTVRDDTGNLWWHPPVDRPEWNSLAKTGHRGLTALVSGGRPLVAALSTWLHLAPFRTLITESHVPDPVRELKVRAKPLLEQLQKALYFQQSTSSSSAAISLVPVVEALKWYGWVLNSSTDVVAVWEMIRQLLNEEKSDVQDAASFDCFRDVYMLRQNPQPDPLNPDTKMDRTEPHSVQEIVDDGLSADTSVFRNWEGFYGASQSLSNAPPILQIELHRQNYSIEARKWTKLTHLIELNETIVLKTSHDIVNASPEYTIFGFIGHSGRLESDRFYSILRPNGPGSKWIAYGEDKQGNVRFLTRKDAIGGHQGAGDVAEGTDAVAYVVIYIRTDCLQDILPNSPKPWAPSKALKKRLDAVPKPPELTIVSEDTSMIPVQVYDSSMFKGFSNRGFLDPWSPQALDPDAKRTYYLEFPPTATFHDVQRYLVTELNLAALPEQCRMWPLTTGLSSRQWSPLLTNIGPEARIGVIAASYGGCRLWLHIVPMESIIQQPRTNIDASIPVSDAEADQSIPTAETIPDDASEGAVASETDIILIPNTGIGQNSVQNEDVEMGGTQEESQERMSEQGLAQVAEEGQPQIAEEPAIPPPLEQSSSSPTTFDDLMFFVKVFDSKAQTLIGMGSHFASKKEQIGEVLKRFEYMIEGKYYVIRQEMARWLVGRSLNADGTFESEMNIHRPGSIVVVQEKLSDTESKAISDRGECAEATDYYEYLSEILDPVYLRPQYTYSYFGNFYFDMSLKCARAHGHCTKIDMNGTAYVGNYTSGCHAGNGTMAYANGDTYTGNWEDDLPNGQGKIVYAKTRNTYVGGWKDGKRNGKGIMHYEVADEEQQLCKICFEAEMDALLYTCGHVVACEECARQVKVCPVCRKNVTAVVKIYRT